MNQLLRSSRIKCKMDLTECLSFIFRRFWVWFRGNIKMSNYGNRRWSIVKTNVFVLIISI